MLIFRLKKLHIFKYQNFHEKVLFKIIFLMINMEKLDNKKLNEILKKINTDLQTREQYDSKLDRILKFLNNNTGLKNALSFNRLRFNSFMLLFNINH